MGSLLAMVMALLLVSGQAGPTYASDDLPIAAPVWERVLRAYVSTLIVDPQRPGRLLAGGDVATFPGRMVPTIYVSDDGGATWGMTVPPTPEPKRDNWAHALALAADGTLYLAPGASGLLRTYDLLTWDNIAPTMQVQALAADPTDPNRLYVFNSRGSYRTDDGGQSWQSLALNPICPWGGAYGEIAVHPTDPQTVYVGGCDIQRSRDGGQTWHHLPGPPDTARRFALDPADPSRIFALGDQFDSDNPMLRHRTLLSGLWGSGNRGDGWRFFDQASISAVDVRLDPRDPTHQTLLEVGSRGPRWSRDGGVSWSELGGGAPPGSTVLASGDYVYVVGQGDGVWRLSLPPGT